MMTTMKIATPDETRTEIKDDITDTQIVTVEIVDDHNEENEEGYCEVWRIDCTKEEKFEKKSDPVKQSKPIKKSEFLKKLEQNSHVALPTQRELNNFEKFLNRISTGFIQETIVS